MYGKLENDFPTQTWMKLLTHLSTIGSLICVLLKYNQISHNWGKRVDHKVYNLHDGIFCFAYWKDILGTPLASLLLSHLVKEGNSLGFKYGRVDDSLKWDGNLVDESLKWNVNQAYNLLECLDIFEVTTQWSWSYIVDATFDRIKVNWIIHESKQPC